MQQEQFIEAAVANRNATLFEVWSAFSSLLGCQLDSTSSDINPVAVTRAEELLRRFGSRIDRRRFEGISLAIARSYALLGDYEAGIRVLTRAQDWTPQSHGANRISSILMGLRRKQLSRRPRDRYPRTHRNALTDHLLIKIGKFGALSAMRMDFERVSNERDFVKKWPRLYDLSPRVGMGPHWRVSNALSAFKGRSSGYETSNPGTARYLGREGNWFKDRHCSEPWKRADIDEDGNVQLCCGTWLRNAHISNAYDGDLLARWKSGKSAQEIRQTILSSTFEFCDETNCSRIAGKRLPLRDEVPPIELTVTATSGPEAVLFALDQTCNLSCPSCRTKVIAADKSLQSKQIDVSIKEITPLLQEAAVLDFNVAGELWVSEASRALMRSLSTETHPRLKLKIISNGTVFTQKNWNTFPNIHPMVTTVRFSVDAASSATFAKIRRGGNWSRFLDNMTFVKNLREHGQVEELWWSFTYQLDNYLEIPAFLKLAAQYSVDKVIFEPLNNWGTFSEQEFQSRAVHVATHPNHRAFLAILNDLGLEDDFLSGGQTVVVPQLVKHE